MADGAERLTLEERQLALEERKWADEFSLRKLEMEARARESTWAAKLFSPITATILAGAVTVGGSVYATLLQNAHSLRLEQQRFEANKALEREKFEASKTLDSQKQQHEMILKMISVEDVEQARTNLRFLAETQLITDKKLADRLLAAKELPLIRPPTATSAPVAAIPSVTADEVRRLVSEDAVNLVIFYELGGGREKYESKSGRPIWPGGASGIVIGIGYDLGYQTADKLQQDWGPYLKKPDIDRLATVVGLKGSVVGARVEEFSDISVPWEAAHAVFSSVELPRWATLMERNLPNARDLPPHSYGALLSLTFNRGTVFNRAGDRYTEMRQIRTLMEAKQFGGVPDQLRAMKRLWPELKGLQERREQEAKLFEKGLLGTE